SPGPRPTGGVGRVAVATGRGAAWAGGGVPTFPDRLNTAPPSAVLAAPLPMPAATVLPAMVTLVRVRVPFRLNTPPPKAPPRWPAPAAPFAPSEIPPRPGFPVIAGLRGRRQPPRR